MNHSSGNDTTDLPGKVPAVTLTFWIIKGMDP